jgi:hypothetical protein
VVRPSFVVFPGWQYKPGVAGDATEGTAGAAFLEQLKSAIDDCVSHDAVPIVLTPFPTNSLGAEATEKHGWDWLRAEILAMRTAGTTIIDAAEILGNQTGGTLDGTYKPDCTSDYMNPNDFGHRQIAEALIAQVERLIDEGAEVISPAPMDPPAPTSPGLSPANVQAESDGPAMSEIMMAFESLGGAGHGCEFGLVQRQFGAEPLGLLRWADLAPQLLCAALECEFDGVGDAENTEVFLPEGRGDHYWSRDRRFWMAQGFHIPAHKLTIEAATEQICRRHRFLRQKLLTDLREGNKIFVFKDMFRPLSNDDLSRLHAAVRNYGDNTLLYVRVEDTGHVNGTVEWVKPGLMVGYIDHFKFSPTDQFLGSSSASWAIICRNAYALWQGLARRQEVGDPMLATEPLRESVSQLETDSGEASYAR